MVPREDCVYLRIQHLCLCICFCCPSGASWVLQEWMKRSSTRLVNETNVKKTFSH